MSADHKPETTSPMLWTLALFVFTGITMAWIFYWLDKGYTHGMTAPKSAGASAAAGEGAPDHKKLIETLNDDVLAKGEQIYNAYCASCHGADGTGSALSPTARNFATESFKNDEYGAGAHPWTMYETVTNGYQQMAAQKILIPEVEDRYAVVHYIRETFVKPNNESQYVSIEETVANSDFPAPQAGGGAVADTGPHPSTLPIAIPVYAVLEQTSAANESDKSQWLATLDTRQTQPGIRAALEALQSLAGTKHGQRIDAAVDSGGVENLITVLLSTEVASLGQVFGTLSRDEFSQLYATLAKSRK